MQRLFCALVALSVIAGAIAGAASPAAAAEGYSQKKGQAKAKKHRRAPREREPGTYIERDANKLPYGTGSWWEQMDREGRGGQQGGGGFD